MGKLMLTPKGQEYLRQQKEKNPEFRKLCEQMGEALKTMPRDRKGLMEACYGKPMEKPRLPPKRDKYEAIKV